MTGNQFGAALFPLFSTAAALGTSFFVKRIYAKQLQIVVQARVAVEATKVPAESLTTAESTIADEVTANNPPRRPEIIDREPSFRQQRTGNPDIGLSVGREVVRRQIERMKKLRSDLSDAGEIADEIISETERAVATAPTAGVGAGLTKE